MRHLRNRLSILIIFLIMFALLSNGPINWVNQASANQSRALSDEPGGGEISARSSVTKWKPATKPWSKDRMLQAKPYPFSLEITNSTPFGESTQSPGIPGTIQSIPPQGSEISIMDRGDLAFFARAALLDESFPYGYVPPYTSFQNFDSYQRFPYSTVGVLFFHRDGSDFQCTAASIGNDAVWTAGRCLHNGDGTEDGWSTDIVFVPAYRDGTEPYGQWSAYNLWTKGQWYANADPSFDMGGVNLNPNGADMTISQVVGNLGFTYNLSEYQAWFNVGYPDDTPFNGKWQYICAASYAYSDINQNEPYPMAMGCDMNGGATGSPWIMNFSGSSGSANYLNGNSSYKAAGEPESIYSPFFGNAAKSLWDTLMSD
jgi:V8-like Glu-specific endopeptidase